MSTVLTLALIFVFGFHDNKEESTGLTTIGWQQVQSGKPEHAEKSFQAATKVRLACPSGSF